MLEIKATVKKSSQITIIPKVELIQKSAHLIILLI